MNRKILGISLAALALVILVMLIVFLINRAPTPTNELVQTTQQDTAKKPVDAGKDANLIAGADLSAPVTQTVCGDVTLTVESHCQYLANIIPTETLLKITEPSDATLYQSDTLQICITECSLIDLWGYAIGHQPVENAEVKLAYGNGSQECFSSDVNGICPPVIGFSPGFCTCYIVKDGYEAYTSNRFYLEWPIDASDEIATMVCPLVPEGCVFSNGFAIQ